MADTTPKPDAIPGGGQYQPPKPPPKQNPVFRMMGKLCIHQLPSTVFADNLQDYPTFVSDCPRETG
jgi:hypothetical protein